MEPRNFRQLANNIVISYLIQVMVKNEPSTIVSGDGVQPKSSEVLQAIAEIRRNYTNELEQAFQSEKRKQDLLAELAMEEERGQELSKIVKELLPSPKVSAVPERQSRSRRVRILFYRMA
ncbi:hypothetical protein GW17_00035321 [Ensete ventricosum]|nr:hypothetical protein GW17_00035321 [Ensete ventricosum]RZR96399.1 hypothetical protein BHM03_00025407 [Ensete ventricosum]